MKHYDGSESFTLSEHQIDKTMLDFWRWAYSDLSNNIHRSVLAEYIVASGLGITNQESERSRQMWRPYDLLLQNSPEDIRVEVKSAAYVQSWDAKHPDRITFRIAPAILPDETGDYKIGAEPTRNSDAYVFAIFTAMSVEQSPLNLDLWDFYILPTKILDEKVPKQKTISLPSLLRFNPVKCKYAELKRTLLQTMNA